MAIEGFGGIYTLECDVCGNEAEEDFDSFEEALAFKRDKINGWRSRHTEGNWQDVCPDCQ